MDVVYDVSSLYDLTDAFAQPLYYEVFISLTLWTLWLLAVGGNILVIVIFLRDRSLRNKVANRYILNLAVADLLVGVNSLTIKNLWRYYGNWPFGEFVCKMYVIVDYSAVCQSVFAITLISFDRYLLVTKELAYGRYQTKRTSWILIVATWTMSFSLFGLPVLLYEPLTENPSIKPYWLTCYLAVSYLTDYNIVVLVMTFMIPSFTLVFFNISVFVNIYRRSRGLLRTQIFALPESTSNSLDEQWANPRPPPSANVNVATGCSGGGAAISPRNIERQPGANRRPAVPTKMMSYRRHYKAAVTLSLLVGLFLICGTPLYVFKCLLIFRGFDPAWVWWNVVDYMTWGNSAINPFLYAVTNPRIRAGYRSILCFWRKPQPLRTLNL